MATRSDRSFDYLRIQAEISLFVGHTNLGFESADGFIFDREMRKLNGSVQLRIIESALSRRGDVQSSIDRQVLRLYGMELLQHDGGRVQIQFVSFSFGGERQIGCGGACYGSNVQGRSDRAVLSPKIQHQLLYRFIVGASVCNVQRPRTARIELRSTHGNVPR